MKERKFACNFMGGSAWEQIAKYILNERAQLNSAEPQEMEYVEQ